MAMIGSTARTWTLPAMLLALLLLPIHHGARADEPARAGLVIQNEGGEVLTRCVEWEGGELSGADVLVRSGLDVVVDPGSSMGVMVCQIEGEGCAFPSEPCFCQCMGGGECIYWNYYSRDPGESDWLYSIFGAAVREVRPGSVEAWVWGEGKTPPAADLTFESICRPSGPASPTPEPTREEPTRMPLPSPTVTGAPATPTAAQASPTELLAATPVLETAGPLAATDPHTPSATPTVSTAPAAAPAGSDPTLASYWPFGLMLLGLAGAGVLIWRRRG